MKIITCASFYASGSSALTDLVAEYEGVCDLTDYEFRFLHDIDGVSDLEYQLVDCHNRHNAGHALKRFERLSRFNAGTFFNSRYEPFFNNQYMKLTKEYINNLTDFKFKGWWFYDLYDKGRFFYYTKQMQQRIISKLPGEHKGILAKEETYCSHPSREKFLKCTREYVSKLMHAANSENMPYLEIDQIVPSQNLNKILRYFSDEICVFIVDRDPRDVYALEHLYLHERICPSQDVNEFCDWYLYTHKSGNPEEYDKNVVRRLQFEDLIYNYERVLPDIERFIGLDSSQHKNQYSKLNPLRSVHNTQIWKGKGIDKDIEIIQNRLGEYLYDFDSVKENSIVGIPVCDKTVF